MVMQVRRDKLADDDMFKLACKQPKPVKRPENKNVSRDSIGNKRGKVFVQQQDYSNLALKKNKKAYQKREE